MGGRWVGTGGAVSPHPCPALGPLSASGRGLPHLPVLKASPPSQALVVLLAAPAPRSSGARRLLPLHPGWGGASLPYSPGLQRGSCSPKEGGGPVSTASQSLIFSQNCIGVFVCLGGFEQSGKAHAIMRNMTVDDSGHSIPFAVSCSFLMEGTDPQLGESCFGWTLPVYVVPRGQNSEGPQRSRTGALSTPVAGSPPRLWRRVLHGHSDGLMRPGNSGQVLATPQPREGPTGNELTSFLPSSLPLSFRFIYPF